MQKTDGSEGVSNHTIIISNIKDGETLSYSLALIKGYILIDNPSDPISPISDNNVSLLHKCSSKTWTSEWPVQNSEFKILVDLSCGTNQLTFQFCDSTLTLTVCFNARKSAYHVTPVYIICKGHDGKFQAPSNEDNSIESACQRISTGARLIQCLTAEKLFETDLGRKTFQLDRDITESAPQCVVFHSDLDVEQARVMEAGELWAHVGRELMLSPLGSERRKFMAFLSCTRYRVDDSTNPPQTHEQVLATTQAHVALGGGGLALFGTACLHTWPTCVEDVQSRFLDQTRVDICHLMDDSCYRGTYGACFATTLGSVCHELGHTFDLGHSEGIMGRGFDNVDLVFSHPQSVDDNISDDNSNVVLVDEKDVARHSTICFTNTLNLSYKLGSPFRRPRRKEQRDRSVKSRQTWTTDGQLDIKNKHCRNNINVSLKSCDDHTFWSNSCAVLLSFHRWFNDEFLHQTSGSLKYEAARKLLTSKAGIRIVEIRDPTGLVLHNWEFLGNRGREMFILPTGVWYRPENTLVAEDSDGDVLKSSLTFCGLPLPW